MHFEILHYRRAFGFYVQQKRGDLKPKDWELLFWNSEHITALEIGWSNNILFEDRLSHFLSSG